MTCCPVCVTYPAPVQARVEAAGRAHHTALLELRIAEESGTSIPATERMTGGATWFAHGAPWDAPVPA